MSIFYQPIPDNTMLFKLLGAASIPVIICLFIVKIMYVENYESDENNCFYVEFDYIINTIEYIVKIVKTIKIIVSIYYERLSYEQKRRRSFVKYTKAGYFVK